MFKKFEGIAHLGGINTMAESPGMNSCPVSGFQVVLENPLFAQCFHTLSL